MWIVPGEANSHVPSPLVSGDDDGDLEEPLERRRWR